MADRQIVARTLGRSRAGALAVGQGLALAIPIGLAGGVAGTAFHIAVEQVTGLRGAHGWLLWLLPAAGLGIVALYQALGCQGLGTDDVLRTVQEGQPLPLALAPAIFLGAVLTHLCGGSAGREGAALQIGGSIGWAIGGWEKQSPAGQRCAAMCGMAALFSALFGTPLAAAMFAVTVAQVGDSFALALAPSLAAAVIASGVSAAAGIPPTAFAVEMPALTGRTALQAAGLGVACAAVTRGFCWVLHQSKHLLTRYLPGPALGFCLQGPAHGPDPGGRVQGGRGGAQLLRGGLLRLRGRAPAGPARRGGGGHRPGIGVLRSHQHPRRLHPAGGGALRRPGGGPLCHRLRALLLAVRQPRPLRGPAVRPAQAGGVIVCGGQGFSVNFTHGP